MEILYESPEGGKLYVGGDEDYKRVDSRESWKFLRCCKEGIGGHRDLLGYHTLAAPHNANRFWVIKDETMALNVLDLDDPFFVPDAAIQKGLKFVDSGLKDGLKVLIACNQGKSRGPSIALLFLHLFTNEYPERFRLAQKKFKYLYPKYDPGMGIETYIKSKW